MGNIDKTQRGFIATGVVILAGLVLYPLEKSTVVLERNNITLEATRTGTTTTGHDWIWDVEGIAYGYMALEVVAIGIVLYAVYWAISGS